MSGHSTSTSTPESKSIFQRFKSSLLKSSLTKKIKKKKKGEKSLAEQINFGGQFK